MYLNIMARLKSVLKYQDVTIDSPEVIQGLFLGSSRASRRSTGPPPPGPGPAVQPAPPQAPPPPHPPSVSYTIFPLIKS